MHTTKIDDHSFIHDGDFHGPVTLVALDGSRVVIAASTLIEFVSEIVRRERLARLEQAGARELLGLDK